METNDIGDQHLPLQQNLQQDDDISEIKLSDVIEVLRDDMFQNTGSIINTVAGNGGAVDHSQQQNNGFNGQLPPQQQQPAQTHQQQPANSSRSIRRNASVKITEQPASKALRFRYECEGRSAGSIPGVNSTPENKTFPTIEIVGYKGRAVVVVSCVTKDHDQQQKYKPHPHNLVGKEGCKKGVCTLEINSETMRAVFSNLGIQCVKKKDIEAALKAREDIRVDPYKTGFSHRLQPSSIDLNSVRLCFQVFLESEQKGRFTVPLDPVVSDPIYDKKAMSDLVICTLCSCTSTVAGGKEIILLCEKVAKEDISIRFYEENNGHVIWEGFGDFQHTDVHKQTAIKFKTPRYKTLELDQPAKVYIQLRRPSDGATSESLPFDYLPLDSGRRSFWVMRRHLKRKPDIDIFQRILSEDSESYKQPTPPEEVTTPDTPSSSEDYQITVPQNLRLLLQQQESQSSVEDSLTVEEEIKRSNEMEVDSIVHDKIIEMEQQEFTEKSPDLSLNDANTQTSESLQKQVQDQINLHEYEPAENKLADFEPTQNDIDINEPAENNKIDCTTGENELAEFVLSQKILAEHEVAENEIRDSEMKPLQPNDKITEWMKSSEFERTNHTLSDQTASTPLTSGDEDKTLNDLLDQVAELDEIYTDHVIKRDTLQNTVANEINAMPEIAKNESMDFDDAATYTSLQIAFKNPLPMTDIMPPTPPTSEDINYDPVEIVVNPPVVEEKLPPLPPKRAKKQAEPEPSSTSSSNNLSRPQSQIFIMKTPEHSPPTKKLPPTPNKNANNNTLPRPKKQGFFSKLFSRKKSKSDINSTGESPSSPQSKATTPCESREPSIGNFNMGDSNRCSFKSIKSLQPTVTVSNSSSPSKSPFKTGKPVGRSVSSVSGKRPHLQPDVIHIRLKGDGNSTNSLGQNEAYSNASTITLNNLDRKTVSALQLADIPITDGNMELVAIADAQSLKNLCEGQYGVQLDPNVDLTECEHFALYTSIPPQATTSEFDETSCYYAPVDAGEILTPSEIAKRLAEANK